MSKINICCTHDIKTIVGVYGTGYFMTRFNQLETVQYKGFLSAKNERDKLNILVMRSKGRLQCSEHMTMCRHTSFYTIDVKLTSAVDCNEIYVIPHCTM